MLLFCYSIELIDLVNIAKSIFILNDEFSLELSFHFFVEHNYDSILFFFFQRSEESASAGNY